MKVLVISLVALVALLAVVVLADQMSNCRCFFTGPCIQAEDGTWVRYYQCTSSCYAYSGYERYHTCGVKGYEPRELFQENE